MKDYSERLLAARAALRVAEEAACEQDWRRMQAAAAAAAKECAEIETWAIKHRESAPGSPNTGQPLSMVSR